MAAEELEQCLINLLKGPIRCVISTCFKNQKKLKTQLLKCNPDDKQDIIKKLISFYEDFIRKSDLLFTNNPSEERPNENQEKITIESEREDTRRELERTKTQLKAITDELIKTNELLNAEKVLRSNVETERDSLACLAEKLELIFLKYERCFSSDDKTVPIDTSKNDKPTVESDSVTGYESNSNWRLEIRPLLSPKNIANNNRPTPSVRNDKDVVLYSEIENSSRAIQEHPSSTFVNGPDTNVLISSKANTSGQPSFECVFRGVSLSNKTFPRNQLQRHNKDNQSSDRSQFIIAEKTTESLPQQPACKQRGPNDNQSQLIIAENTTESLPQLPARKRQRLNDNQSQFIIAENTTDGLPQLPARIQRGLNDTPCESREETQSTKDHKASHSSQRPFQCSICYNWFKTVRTRKKHIRVIHEGRGKEFWCSYCNRKFNQKCHLCRHIRSQHLSAPEKPYKCATCDKSFFRKYHLKRHLTKHTSERSHKCSICEKSFKRRDQKYRHEMNVHAEGYRFPCARCEKRFCSQPALLSHMRRIHL